MIPNERPTPLTDAAWADKEQNILVHAKNLERSLAERTEERDKLLEKQSWLIAHPTAIEAAHQVVEWTKCEQERDTALAKLAERTEERDKWANVAAQYSAEREHNANMALAYKAERDTALAKLAKCREALESVADELKAYGESEADAFYRQTLEETK